VSPGNASPENLDLNSVPEAPRVVPAELRRRSLRGPAFWIGLAFAALGGLNAVIFVTVGAAAHLKLLMLNGIGLGGPFCVAGLVVLSIARSQGRRIVEAAQVGAPVIAQITSSQLDLRLRVNGKNPWRVAYTFEIDGRQVQGSQSTWNHEAGQKLTVGSRVIALPLPEDANVSCLYPWI